ncbi:hypothetical protein GDO86_000403 [Hymenochirus boettgeri]|uniref:Uncharacterized protein n=1 Tax=Hymenochirus boettgeri TaxID=247094 RepID=A0A8T2KGM7_9PIPI|nr:hypothetical protein GDO86_000403 [Hymenochirus boettgeri]
MEEWDILKREQEGKYFGNSNGLFTPEHASEMIDEHDNLIMEGHGGPDPSILHSCVISDIQCVKDNGPKSCQMDTLSKDEIHKDFRETELFEAGNALLTNEKENGDTGEYVASHRETNLENVNLTPETHGLGDLCKSTAVDSNIVQDKQLLNSAFIAQQRRKHFASKYGNRNCFSDEVDDRSPNPYEYSKTAPETGLKDSIRLSHLHSDGGLRIKNRHLIRLVDGFPNSFKMNIKGAHLADISGREGIRTSTIHEKVRLRRKKRREDNDRSRIDSMILLIMKLDQLDQDIEDALSSQSSTNKPETNRTQLEHLHCKSPETYLPDPGSPGFSLQCNFQERSCIGDLTKSQSLRISQSLTQLPTIDLA